MVRWPKSSGSRVIEIPASGGVCAAAVRGQKVLSAPTAERQIMSQRFIAVPSNAEL
jgi:hypothetical protein